MTNIKKITRLVTLAGETEGKINAAIFVLEEEYPKAKALINMLKSALKKSDETVTKIILDNEASNEKIEMYEKDEEKQ